MLIGWFIGYGAGMYLGRKRRLGLIGAVSGPFAYLLYDILTTVNESDVLVKMLSLWGSMAAIVGIAFYIMISKRVL